MFRITNNMLYNSNLYNVFKNNEGMLKAQEELASGKRINRPSDDPYGTSQLLKFRTERANNEQNIKNIEEGLSWLNLADSALNNMGNLLSRARELAVGQANGTANASTRLFIASEIDSIISEMTRLGNTAKGDEYIFSGDTNSIKPFASGAVYYGGSNETLISVYGDEKLGIGLDGSGILAANLDPDIDSSTLLSSLNGGQGIALGSIQINDRAGVASTISLSGASTVGDVLTAINGGGANVTASINSSGTGIQITDNTSIPISNLTISEVSGGSTAVGLGLLSNRPLSTHTGLDLNPNLTASTSFSQVNRGSGLSLTAINIANGSASGTVTLSTATTIGDVISQINAASLSQGLNVTASLNSSGTALNIVSNDPTTVATVTEVGNGSSASDLGVGGSKNTIKMLYVLRDALLQNDGAAVSTSIGLMITSLDNILIVRADVGSRVNRLETMKESLQKSNDDIIEMQSKVEDADMVKAASDLARYQTAYQAALKSSAMIIQPSLLDFIR